VELLDRGVAERLLITGVNEKTTREEIVRQRPELRRLFSCCVDLDYLAQNTIGNAMQTRDWVQERGFRSLLVVTSSSHMPRSLAELGHALPQVKLIPHPVVPGTLHIADWWREPATAKLLAVEYAKFLVALARIHIGAGTGVSAVASQAREGSRWPCARPEDGRRRRDGYARAALTRSRTCHARLACPSSECRALRQSDRVDDRGIAGAAHAPASVDGLCARLGRFFLWLCRVVGGMKVEFRGLDRIPDGPLLIAAKHQSLWETFALLAIFRDPCFILKRELTWIPLFGWYAIRARQLPVDRKGGSSVLRDLGSRARDEVRRGKGRQLLFFPEGTRRPAGGTGLPPRGVAYLRADRSSLPAGGP
jgi:1-acyl-sn-glycerol-3-phosphate acyltransferase